MVARRGFILPVVITLIVILGIVALWKLAPKFSLRTKPQTQEMSKPAQTPTEVSVDWRAYKNDTLEFKYPSNWVTVYNDKRQGLSLCDYSPSKSGVQFLPCQASGITPTASITYVDLLNVRPESSFKESYYPNPAIQLHYYENPENLSVQDFSKKYLSEGPGGDPIALPSGEDKKTSNANGISAYYVESFFCVAVCQAYIIPTNGRIYILKNFPTYELNQLDIFKRIFTSLKLFK